MVGSFVETLRAVRRGASREVTRLLGAFVAVSLVAGLLLSALVMPGVAAAGMAVNDGADYFASLPAQLARPPLPQRSVLLAADGSPITYFYDENRLEVPLAQMSRLVQGAVVAMEDSRFFEHGGVDPRGLVRAFVNDTAGGSVQGASTLTQQYVKNVLLETAVANGDAAAARAAVERSTIRKLKEMRLAVALEQQLTKPQILESYLNIAFFGGRTYGIEAASERYFGVTAQALTLGQAATLAGMISEPSRYDPIAHPKASRQRRDIVLGRMLALRMIDQAQYDQVRATPTPARGKPPLHGCTAASFTGFFCDYVVRSMLQQPEFAALGRTAQERLAAVNRAGLVIRTTLDGSLQYAANEAVNAAIPATDSSGLGTASVTVEAGTGRVLAMVQNRRYGVSDGAGVTAVNWSVDHDLGGGTGFQTGSSFKPFTLAAWLDAGHSLNDSVDATKRSFPFSAFRACGSRLRSTQPYEPGNSEGHETGSMSVLEATFNSVNVAYVDMESRLDMCDVTGLAERLGMHLAQPGTDCTQEATARLPACVPSLTLGPKEIAPLTMAAAYAGFATGGTYCRPIAVLSLERTSGSGAVGSRTPVGVPAQHCERAISTKVARGVTAALTQVLTKGTAAGVGPIPGHPSAGKTGTTDGPYDTWFVGYTPQRSTAVWVGDPGRVDSESKQLRRRQLTGITINGERHGIVYGATIAAPVWKNVMEAAMEGQPDVGWR